jgi:hypothetical protein
MNKFIYKKDQNYTDHWEFCNQNKYPFITINHIDNGFSELFFDITNISNKLEDISNSIKEISSCYNNFFLVPSYILERYESQYYYFKFPVINTHAELIANQLFDYLLENIS